MNNITLFKLFLFAFIAISNFNNIRSYLIGIDLGTEFFKATMLRPSRPFTMVENIQSKTKTPTAVAFKDDERVFGADAMAKKPRLPKGVLTFFHEYLGKRHSSDEVKNFIKRFFVSYEMEEDEKRGTTTFKITFNKEEFKFSTEEVYGMIFRYIKYLADKFSQADIKDCVVTVPSFFGYKQRQALAQAVEMSKLNLLSFVSENVAAAVQFSMNKNFNTTEHYIFYNMGASYTQATLVSYLSNMQTKNNKTTEVSKTLTVLGETWDSELGGNRFSYNLVRHLMKKFDELPSRQNKPSVMDDYRVVERILPSATKYKEILSANKDVPVSILSVESGMNLQTRISRDEFEEINNSDFDKVYDPIERLLNKTGVSIDDIAQIELLGGSIRVPKVQEVLKAKLGNYSNLVGTHMNGDDSMAFGAAYICANFSSNFKGAKIDLKHGANYEVNLRLNHIQNENDVLCGENVTEIAENCVRKLQKNTTLYKVRYGLDLARTVSFKHDGDLTVQLLEKFDDSEEKLLVTYFITGMTGVKNNLKQDNVNVLPKVNLRFKQDYKGLISLTADATYEETLYMNLKTSPKGDQEVIYHPNVTAPLPAEEIKAYEEELKTQNLTNAARTTLINMRKDVGKKRTREEKIALTITPEFTIPRPLSKEEIAEAKVKLDKLDEIDRNRIATMEKRNSLETLIYAKKEWLETKEAAKFSKDGELEDAAKTLNEVSEWYDEEGYNALFDTLDTKFNALNDKFKVFENRITKFYKCEKSVENFLSEIKKIKGEAATLIKNKPWAEAHYNNTFTNELKAVEDWFNKTKEAQDKLALYEVIYVYKTLFFRNPYSFLKLLSLRFIKSRENSTS
jgi:hypoxia up-regulated 1